MKFARNVFAAAGIYGLVAMIPQYFTEERVGRDFPPAVTHPEFYYGFIGITLVFQILFLMIARDPMRYRPVMLVAVLEKLSFAVAVPVLFALGRTHGVVLAFACIDMVLAILFTAAYAKTEPAAGQQGDVRAA